MIPLPMENGEHVEFEDFTDLWNWETDVYDDQPTGERTVEASIPSAEFPVHK
jgi:hypothetical protein